jgi:hypothetical protein
LLLAARPEDDKHGGRRVGEEEMNGREYHAATPALTDFWDAGQEALPSLGAEHKNRHCRSEQDRSTITQAEIFHDFMRAVWDNAIKDENGNTKYNEYSDARSVAQAMGAKVVARVDDWNDWLFPDGSTVEILNDGSDINNARP